nr:PTS sugar transporter subunit IIA [Spirochaetaceae bacterium]
MNLGSFIDKKAIITGGDFSSVTEAVDAIIDLFDNRGLLPVSAEEVRIKIKERELLGGTVLPSGVAIPHARLEGFDDLLIGVWVPKKTLSTSQGDVDFLFFFLTSKIGSPFYLSALGAIA